MEPNGVIDFYQVNVTLITGGNPRKRQDSNTRTEMATTNHIVIGGLMDEAAYRITVQAISVGGVRGMVYEFPGPAVVNVTAPSAPPTVELPPEGVQPFTFTVPLSPPSSYGPYVL